jgi:hypothetical protein
MGIRKNSSVLRERGFGPHRYTIRYPDGADTILPVLFHEPCLFRYIYEREEFYLLQYVDDLLLSGTVEALNHLKQQLQKHFKCKFIKPKDFLGLDVSHPKPGEITLSMKSFSTKMEEVLQLPGDILTPGRTDKKIIRGQKPEDNDEYRSHVGTLNWLSMGVRFDIVYTTKEL